MSLSTVISGFPAKTRCEILGKISSYSSILYDSASTAQIEFMAASIDEVSNGSGLQLISILLWPSDDLTGITFMDGSGLLIDLHLNTVELIDV